jgi:hypothetical protein
LFQLEKTTFSMPGGHHMEHLYSRSVYKAIGFVEFMFSFWFIYWCCFNWKGYTPPMRNYMVMNIELVRKWKEAVLSYLKLLSQHVCKDWRKPWEALLQIAGPLAGNLQKLSSAKGSAGCYMTAILLLTHFLKYCLVLQNSGSDSTLDTGSVF